MSDAVRHDEAAGRYELVEGGAVAHADYARDGDVLVFTHTLVPPELRDHGVGTRLIAGALADVRRTGRRVVAQCPFVAAYIDAHPEDRDLLAG